MGSSLVPVAPEPGGRPTKYDADLVEEVLTRLKRGELLAWICQDTRLPDAETVEHWAVVYPRFGERLETCQRLCHDVIAATILMDVAVEDPTVERTVEVDSAGYKKVTARTKDNTAGRVLRVRSKFALLAQFDPRYRRGPVRDEPDRTPLENGGGTRITVTGGLPDDVEGG